MTRRLIRAGARRFSPLARRLTRGAARILMYHRFGRFGEPRRLDATTFEQQIQHLQRHFQPTRLDAVVERLRRGAPLTHSLVSVTVDDGYADFYDVAYPILQRYGVPATVFVVSRFSDQAIWLWFDALHYLVHKAPVGRYRPVIAGRCIDVRLDGHAGRQGAWERLADLCMPLGADERVAKLSALAEHFGVELPPTPTESYRAMTWDEIRRLDPELIEVGAQTCTHPLLAQSSPAELDLELNASKAAIEREIRRPVRSFCYPGGRPQDYNQQVLDAVQRAGYECGVVAHGTLVRPGAPLFALARLGAPAELQQFQNLVDGYPHLLGRTRTPPDAGPG